MKRMIFAAALLVGLACAASTSYAQAAPVYSADDVAVPTLAQLPTQCASVDVASFDVRAFAPFDLTHAIQVESGVALPLVWDASTRPSDEMRGVRRHPATAGCTKAST